MGPATRCRSARRPPAGEPSSSVIFGDRHDRIAVIDTALGLGAVLILVLGTGFFVAAEFAFVAVDRQRIRDRAAAGSRSASLVESILGSLSFHLSGAQLGITVTSLLLGFIAEPTVSKLLEPVVGRGGSIALGLVLVTVVSMVCSELVPKNLAIARAEPAAELVARPTIIYGTVFGPIIRALNAAANWTVRRFGIEPQEELSSVRSLEEIEILIRSSGEEGVLDPEAYTLLTRTLRFGSKTAADALVPRLSVTSVHPNDPIGDLIGASIATGFSRFPACGADLDDVVGVVHVKDVYRVPVEARDRTPVAEIMSEPLIVPESRDLGSLLRELKESGSHLAVVVDEYGGTAGIITLEDILEEIVGEIDDEYDPSAPRLTKILPVGTYELPGSLHRDEVLEACGFELPEGEYETLAGFILDQLGRIPDVGDSLTYDGWTIEVTDRDRLRVAGVRLTAPADLDGGADGQGSTVLGIHESEDPEAEVEAEGWAVQAEPLVEPDGSAEAPVTAPEGGR